MAGLMIDVSACFVFDLFGQNVRLNRVLLLGCKPLVLQFFLYGMVEERKYSAIYRAQHHLFETISKINK